MSIHCKIFAIFCGITLAPLAFGTNLHQIAVSENPSKFEKLAANELQYFLNKIGENKYNIVPEKLADAKNIIYLGQTKFAKINGINFDSLEKEEWVLKTIGNKLVVSGGRPVGTLYGVFALLEKLGCYFLTLDQNVIPKIKHLKIPLLNERRKPFFTGRNIYDSYPSMLRKRGIPEDIYWRFRLRSRANGSQGRRPGIIYNGDMFRLSNSLSNFHNFFQYVSPKKYFKSHPEYFNMNKNGKRFIKLPQGSQLCFTNPDVVKITTESLRKFIRRDRKSLPKSEWPIIYDISAMDGTKFMCLCPKCKEITTKEGSAAGLVLRYINAVAKAIANEYPEIMIRTFAYSSAELAPQITRPAPNVIVQYCDIYTKSDCYRPLTTVFNKKQLKKIKDWGKLNSKLALWDYWNMGMSSYFNPPRPEVIIDSIQPDFKLFGRMGIISLFLEAEKNFITPQNFIDLEYFIAYQLMVDPKRDVEKLINIYMNNYYGKAAPLMKQYLQMLRSGVSRHPNAQFTMRISMWHYMTPEFMLKTYKLLHRAETLVKDNDVYRCRVREELISPLWTILYFRSNYGRYFEQNGYKILGLENECRQLVLEFMNKYKPKKLKTALKKFEKRFNILTAHLKCPKKFKNLPPESVKVFGYPHRNLKSTKFYSDIKKDKESITGYTYISENPNPKMHGKNFREKLWGTTFGISNYGNARKVIRITEFPKDEKYHWYKIPNFEIGSKTVFWAHLWWIQYDISSAYANADGHENANVWDVWFSAKFTGPAYVKGSKKKNTICVDMVVLAKSK